MASSTLTGKSKQDLATIAVVSGLLSQEQAGAMSRPELLKFLAQAEKATSKPAKTGRPKSGKTGASSAKAELAASSEAAVEQPGPAAETTGQAVQVAVESPDVNPAEPGVQKDLTETRTTKRIVKSAARSKARPAESKANLPVETTDGQPAEPKQVQPAKRTKRSNGQPVEQSVEPSEVQRSEAQVTEAQASESTEKTSVRKTTRRTAKPAAKPDSEAGQTLAAPVDGGDVTPSVSESVADTAGMIPPVNETVSAEAPATTETAETTATTETTETAETSGPSEPALPSEPSFTRTSNSVRPANRPVRQHNPQAASRPIERIPAQQNIPGQSGSTPQAPSQRGPVQAGPRHPGRPPLNRPAVGNRAGTGAAGGQASLPQSRATGKPHAGPTDTNRGRQQQRGQGTPANQGNQQPGRPVRVKVFGIPTNPLAAQSEEHETALRANEAELVRAGQTSSSPEASQLQKPVKPAGDALYPAQETTFQTRGDAQQAGSDLAGALQPGEFPDAVELAKMTADVAEAVSVERDIRDNETEEQPFEKHGRRPIESGESITGVLEIMPDGYGFLRRDNYLQGAKDAYVPPQYIRRFNLRPGDLITGPCKKQRDNDRYQALLYIKEVNGESPEKMLKRPHFDRLTPVYPNERYVLETNRNELSTRIIDLVAPIGKGQRGMIVSPPKAGKTILLQKIANAISTNNPEVKLIVLLIDERPEEVTDMQRSIKGEVVYSTFDKTPENHVKVTELVLERAMRLVELKQDVVILLDSMTRLGRAYNLTITPTGRTLSGGLDPGALYGPKRFFGAARNIENGGSLTIIATSLIETGSRMDEVIFEEFKGTGNMEVILDRKLSEKRIFPAIDINRSGTRREELLLSNKELDAVWTIRKAFGQLDTAAVTETIINLLLKTQDNQQFISSINVSFNDKNVFEAMRGQRPTTANGSASGSQRRGAGNYDRDVD